MTDLIRHIAIGVLLFLSQLVVAQTDTIRVKGDVMGTDPATPYHDGQPVFTKPEINAQFPGGVTALVRFINEHIEYPERAKKKRISGVVMINFIVNTEGELRAIHVTNNVHPLLEREALRMLVEMPKWIPAEVDGRKVNVSVNLPVNFEIKDPIK